MSKKPLPNPVIEAIRGRGPLSHSALYWWMWDHYDDIHLSRTGRPDWVTATREFSNMGFKGRDDAPLNKENVRKTWTRVVRDKEKLKASARQAQPASIPQPPSVRMLPVTRVIPPTVKTEPKSLSEAEKAVADFRKTIRDASDYGRKKDE